MSRRVRSMMLGLGAMTLVGFGIYYAFRFEIQYYRNRDVIDYAAARYQVAPRLIASVIWQETRFNPICRGRAGEIGLMQIMPQSAAEWAKAEHLSGFNPSTLFDPGTNILAGTWYLGRALRRWSTQLEPIPYALAEYNAGRSKALRWEHNTTRTPELFTDRIEYPSTRSYVRNILRSYSTFGKPWQRW